MPAMAWLPSYLGLAALYAALAAFGAQGVSAALGRPPPRGLPALALATLFVVFLAIHPLPDPVRLDCAAAPRPILQPFQFAGAFRDLWAAGAPPARWLSNLTVTSTITNVAFFALVGAALARLTARAWLALAYAAALTAAIETLQGTGLLGRFPCAYRTVDVNDLILNVAGVMLGFLALRAWRRQSPSSRR